jgi:two-component system cell cycle sensor histidine kinase/response regulator CckA
MSWIADSTGQIVHANSRWVAATGLTAEPWSDLDSTQWVHPKDHAALRQLSPPDQTDTLTCEYRLRSASGAYRWVRENLTALRDADGKLEGFAACAIDIDDQKLSEEIQRLHSRQQTSLTAFCEFVRREENASLINAEVLRLIIQAAEIPCAIILERPPAESVFRPIASVGTAPEALLPYSDELDLLSWPVPGVVETSQLPLHPRNAAELGWSHGFTVPIDLQSASPCYLVCLHGQTAAWPSRSLEFVQSMAAILAVSRHNLQAQSKLTQSGDPLQQSHQMEAVGLLTSCVAHDFNNLLTAIRCLSFLLRDELEVDEQKSIVDDIIHACSNAGHLVQKLNSFSGMEISQPESIDLNAFVDELHPFVQSLLSAHISVELTTGPSPGWISIDRKQLEHAFFNLCLNARDAMPIEGSLRIGVSRMEFPGSTSSVLGPGVYYGLAVSDTGNGIAPEIIDAIFKPFFSTKPQGKGSGLGLANCLAMLRQAHGDVTVESTVGRGTTFTLWLPESAPPRDSHELQTTSAPETVEIMLVEDDELVRSVVGTLIESKGYPLLSFSDPIAALNHAESTGLHHTALLITDIIMPHMDGHALATRLLAIKPNLEVLFVSGYVNNAAITKAIKQDGSNFLAKPYAPKDLFRAVNRILALEKSQ